MRGSIPVVLNSYEEDEFEDEASFVSNEEQQIEYLRVAARPKAEATSSEVPLLLDPKKILEFIDIWLVKPDSPLDDLDIPKDIKLYLQQFLISQDLKKKLNHQLQKVHRKFKKNMLP